MAIATEPKAVNMYANEAKVRKSVEDAAEQERYVVDQYAIADKDDMRTVTVSLVGMTGDDTPLLRKALGLAFLEHHYSIDQVKVTVKATRDTSQLVLPVG